MKIKNTRISVRPKVAKILPLAIFFSAMLIGCSQESKNGSRVSEREVLLDSSLVSKAPMFEFSNDVETQWKQLEDNPLLERFERSRRELSSDPFRPEYHYVNPEGRLNDPNGLCYWNGYWHLFYQAYPPEDPRQHWGHAISKDLVYWKDLPFAIAPFPERAVYSGTTLVENDRVIAMYHGTGQGNMVAISDDPLLLNWKKIKVGPVIPAMEDEPLPFSVFDPTIWKKGERYYSLSAGRVPSESSGAYRRANDLFVSDNLIDWEYLHEFVEGDHYTLDGDDGACPYFLPIGDKYIMPFFSHMSGGQYLLGDYDMDRDKLVVHQGGKFNHGAVGPGGVHAPSATSDGNGGVVVLFNMNPGYPSEEWNQIMSLPRKLTLGENNQLLQEPVEDLVKLRKDHVSVQNVSLPANREIEMKQLSGNVREIETEIEMEENGVVEIKVFKSPDSQEYTRILLHRDIGHSTGLNYIRGDKTAAMPADLLRLFEPENAPERTARKRKSSVTIDVSNSSIDPKAQLRTAETAEVLLEDDENFKIRVFLDKSILEVFVNGKQCLAVRVYPSKQESVGVSFKALGNDARIRKLDSWRLNSIWNDKI